MQHLDFFHPPVSKWDCFPWNLYSPYSGMEWLSVSGNLIQCSAEGLWPVNKYNFPKLASPTSTWNPVLKVQNTAITVRMTPGRCHICCVLGLIMNVWVSFCYPIKTLYCWIPAQQQKAWKGMQVLSANIPKRKNKRRGKKYVHCWHSNREKSDRSMVTYYEKRVISFRKKRDSEANFVLKKTREKSPFSFLTWNFIGWYQSWYNAVSCARRGQAWEGPSTPAKLIHVDRQMGLLYIARWASE